MELSEYNLEYQVFCLRLENFRLKKAAGRFSEAEYNKELDWLKKENVRLIKVGAELKTRE